MRAALYITLALCACARPATAPAPGLVEVAVLTPPSIRAGDTAVVRITVTNTSDQRQAYEGNLCSQGYQVLNAAGANVVPGIGCLFYAKLVELEPGDSAVFTREWAADVPPTTTGQQPVPLPPGTYTLIGAVQPWPTSTLSNISTAVDLTP